MKGLKEEGWWKQNRDEEWESERTGVWKDFWQQYVDRVATCLHASINICDCFLCDSSLPHPLFLILSALLFSPVCVHCNVCVYLCVWCWCVRVSERERPR